MTSPVPGELDLIQRYFASARARSDVKLGIGDDASVLALEPGQELVVTVDTLVEDVHFDRDTSAQALGHKALAVNLSDLAAMGARPLWATLALTLPAVDEPWLAEFSRGFLQLAERFDVALVGGDTTRGPRTITVQALGGVATGAAVTRSGARPGDAVYVTGEIGDAGLALAVQRGERCLPRDLEALCRARLQRPTPRVEAGLALREFAHAAIDVSDGLLGDLQHLLDASGAGARVSIEEVPVSAAIRHALDAGMAWWAPLVGGDDYELVFTVPPPRQAPAEQRLHDLDIAVTRIGHIEAAPGLRLTRGGEAVPRPPVTGFDHFAGSP